MTKGAIVLGPLGLGLSRFLLMCRQHQELDFEVMNEMTILVGFSCSEVKDIRWLWKEHSDLYNYHRRYEEGIVPSILAQSFLPTGVDCSFP